jgi:hypothetical protein
MPKSLKNKTEEVRLCQYVVREMNVRDGTDYYAKDPVYYLGNKHEPIDVELFSESDTYPPYGIQVVTIPSNEDDLELRSPLRNVETLRTRLASALAECGLHRIVGISLGNESLHRMIPMEVAAQFANLIVQNKLKKGVWSLGWREIAEFSPALHKFVRHITVQPASRLKILIHRTAWTPSDARLIEEAISLKEQKYAPAQKTQTALVIGGSPFIDDEQVESYIASGQAAALTFLEVWIVFNNRAIPLKQRRP